MRKWRMFLWIKGNSEGTIPLSAWIMECIFGSSKVAPTLFFSISHLTTKDPLSTCLLLSILISSWFIRYLIMNPLKKISIMGEEKIGILYFRHHSAYRERWPRLGLYNFSCIKTCQYTCIKSQINTRVCLKWELTQWIGFQCSHRIDYWVI